MQSFDPATDYGRVTADIYDDSIGSRRAPEATVCRLVELARGGAALEVGVGTGRVAIPLARAGVDVTGVDSSSEMLEVLRRKSSSNLSLAAYHEDFVAIKLERRFELVYCVFNTLFWFASQDRQLACFQVAAAHLASNGCFVVETEVPDLSYLIGDRLVGVESISESGVQIKVTEHDPKNQVLEMVSLYISADMPIRVAPSRIRYTTPSELDLMAKLSGLDLQSRFGGWSNEPFTGRANVVSVYSRPIEGGSR